MKRNSVHFFSPLLSLSLFYSHSKKKRHRIKRDRAVKATKKCTEFRSIILKAKKISYGLQLWYWPPGGMGSIPSNWLDHDSECCNRVKPTLLEILGTKYRLSLNTVQESIVYHFSRLNNIEQNTKTLHFFRSITEELNKAIKNSD